jgi:hypothetical protein
LGVGASRRAAKPQRDSGKQIAEGEFNELAGAHASLTRTAFRICPAFEIQKTNFEFNVRFLGINSLSQQRDTDAARRGWYVTRRPARQPQQKNMLTS